MKSWIVETNDKIYIDHIPRLEWGQNTENSFIRAAQLTLNAIGESYTYEYLMGISGTAFRVHFHPNWCPSSADATVGFDVSKVLFNALGYTCKLHAIDDTSFLDIRKLFKDIITQIDLGIPIIAINLKSCPDWGIITGYLKNKPGIICRTYHDDSSEYSLAERAPWLSFFIGEKGKTIDNESLFKNSLKIAVELAESKNYENYASGFKSFDIWIDRLHQLKKLKPTKRAKEIAEVNFAIFNVLLDARKSLLKYLVTVSQDLKLSNGSEILNYYYQEVSLLQDSFKHIFLPSVPVFERLTQDQIDELIDALSHACQIEKQAIELIKGELLKLDGTMP